MEGRGGEREASRLRSKYMHRLIEKATQRDSRESRNRGSRFEEVEEEGEREVAEQWLSLSGDAHIPTHSVQIYSTQYEKLNILHTVHVPECCIYPHPFMPIPTIWTYIVRGILLQKYRTCTSTLHNILQKSIGHNHTHVHIFNFCPHRWTTAH